MKLKVLQQGAEAKIILKENFIIKSRIKKSYRLPELDAKIRKSRTKAETKLMLKASKIINVPKLLDSLKSSDTEIIMQYIKGKKLSEHLDKFQLEKQKQICSQIGNSIAKLHDSNIIHGDLTTSNMILVENKIMNDKKNFNKQDKLAVNNELGVGGWGNGGGVNQQMGNNEIILFFIDFGLGFISAKAEDKAVDLHLLKQALEAKHFKNWQELWKYVEVGYKNSKNTKTVFERLRAVEKRGRYKDKS